ncbi:MAG: hypothetical protein HQ575_07765, partial [Candidatus Omnitrophica bacterium]|nr:hypothetical protein [Candidatus Omnitrophota bacterium]
MATTVKSTSTHLQPGRLDFIGNVLHKRGLNYSPIAVPMLSKTTTKEEGVRGELKSAILKGVNEKYHDLLVDEILAMKRDFAPHLTIEDMKFLISRIVFGNFKERFVQMLINLYPLFIKKLPRKRVNKSGKIGKLLIYGGFIIAVLPQLYTLQISNVIIFVFAYSLIMFSVIAVISARTCITLSSFEIILQDPNDMPLLKHELAHQLMNFGYIKEDVFLKEVSCKNDGNYRYGIHYQKACMNNAAIASSIPMEIFRITYIDGMYGKHRSYKEIKELYEMCTRVRKNHYSEPRKEYYIAPHLFIYVMFRWFKENYHDCIYFLTYNISFDHSIALTDLFGKIRKNASKRRYKSVDTFWKSCRKIHAEYKELVEELDDEQAAMVEMRLAQVVSDPERKPQEEATNVVFATDDIELMPYFTDIGLKLLNTIFSPEFIEGVFFIGLPYFGLITNLCILGLFAGLHIFNIPRGERTNIKILANTLLAPILIAAGTYLAVTGIGALGIVVGAGIAYLASIPIHALINAGVYYARKRGWRLRYGAIGREDPKDIVHALRDYIKRHSDRCEVDLRTEVETHDLGDGSIWEIEINPQETIIRCKRAVGITNNLSITYPEIEALGAGGGHNIASIKTIVGIGAERTITEVKLKTTGEEYVVVSSREGQLLSVHRKSGEKRDPFPHTLKVYIPDDIIIPEEGVEIDFDRKDDSGSGSSTLRSADIFGIAVIIAAMKPLPVTAILGSIMILITTIYLIKLVLRNIKKPDRNSISLGMLLTVLASGLVYMIFGQDRRPEPLPKSSATETTDLVKPVIGVKPKSQEVRTTPEEEKIPSKEEIIAERIKRFKTAIDDISKFPKPMPANILVTFCRRFAPNNPFTMRNTKDKKVLEELAGYTDMDALINRIITLINKTVSSKKDKLTRGDFKTAMKESGLDHFHFMGLALQESKYNAKAANSGDGVGVFQVNRTTAWPILEKLGYVLKGTYQPRHSKIKGKKRLALQKEREVLAKKLLLKPKINLIVAKTYINTIVVKEVDNVLRDTGVEKLLDEAKLKDADKKAIMARLADRLFDPAYNRGPYLMKSMFRAFMAALKARLKEEKRVITPEDLDFEGKITPSFKRYLDNREMQRRLGHITGSVLGTLKIELSKDPKVKKEREMRLLRLIYPEGSKRKTYSTKTIREALKREAKRQGIKPNALDFEKDIVRIFNEVLKKAETTTKKSAKDADTMEDHALGSSGYARLFRSMMHKEAALKKIREAEKVTKEESVPGPIGKFRVKSVNWSEERKDWTYEVRVEAEALDTGRPLLFTLTVRRVNGDEEEDLNSLIASIEGQDHGLQQGEAITRDDILRHLKGLLAMEDDPGNEVQKGIFIMEEIRGPPGYVFGGLGLPNLILVDKELLSPQTPEQIQQAALLHEGGESKGCDHKFLRGLGKRARAERKGKFPGGVSGFIERILRIFTRKSGLSEEDRGFVARVLGDKAQDSLTRLLEKKKTEAILENPELLIENPMLATEGRLKLFLGMLEEEGRFREDKYINYYASKALPFFKRANKACFTKENLELIPAMLRHKNWVIRYYALEAFGLFIEADKTLATEKYLRLILRMLNDEEGLIRHTALKIMPTLIKIVNSKRWTTGSLLSNLRRNNFRFPFGNSTILLFMYANRASLTKKDMERYISDKVSRYDIKKLGISKAVLERLEELCFLEVMPLAGQRQICVGSQQLIRSIILGRLLQLEADKDLTEESIASFRKKLSDDIIPGIKVLEALYKDTSPVGAEISLKEDKYSQKELDYSRGMLELITDIPTPTILQSGEVSGGILDARLQPGFLPITNLNILSYIRLGIIKPRNAQKIGGRDMLLFPPYHVSIQDSLSAQTMPLIAITYCLGDLAISPHRLTEDIVKPKGLDIVGFPGAYNYVGATFDIYTGEELDCGQTNMYTRPTLGFIDEESSQRAFTYLKDLDLNVYFATAIQAYLKDEPSQLKNIYSEFRAKLPSCLEYLGLNDGAINIILGNTYVYPEEPDFPYYFDADYLLKATGLLWDAIENSKKDNVDPLIKLINETKDKIKRAIFRDAAFERIADLSAMAKMSMDNIVPELVKALYNYIPGSEEEKRAIGLLKIADCPLAKDALAPGAERMDKETTQPGPTGSIGKFQVIEDTIEWKRMADDRYSVTFKAHPINEDGTVDTTRILDEPFEIIVRRTDRDSIDSLIASIEGQDHGLQQGEAITRDDILHHLKGLLAMEDDPGNEVQKGVFIM